MTDNTTETPVLTSTKPYLIRAIYEWILDNNLTPHLMVDARYPGTEVPEAFVQEGQIVLNIAPTAVRDLVMDNEWISFGARFSGTPRQILVPSEAVLGIFSRENRQGMVFPEPDYSGAENVIEPKAHQSEPAPRKGLASVDTKSGGGTEKKPGPKGKGGPNLKVVK